MRGAAPILELLMAEVDASAELDVTVPLSLQLMPGDCIVVEAADTAELDAFADLCSGLLPLRAGQIRCLGHDWTDLSHVRAAALRGRIGRVSESDTGLPFLDAEANILLPQLHHTDRARNELRTSAAALAAEFGLPGLPQGELAALAPADVGRAMLVRALIAQPSLLFLHDLAPVLRRPVLNRIAAMLDRGGAVVWLVEAGVVRDLRPYAATQWLRLTEQGLSSAGPAR
jgi:phospholipid/cholesterol/gamma-HCH transport system ATP-binding protein